MRRLLTGKWREDSRTKTIWRLPGWRGLTILLAILLFAPGLTNSFGAILAVTLPGSGHGSVNSAPTGIACPGTCSAPFTTVSLYANPQLDSFFSGWGGACAGLEECVLTLGGDASVTAMFELKSTQFHVSGSNYGAVQVAYNNVANNGRVLVVAADQAGDVTFDKALSFSLEGGYDNAFSSNAGNVTPLHGNAVVSGGCLTVSNIALAPTAPAPPGAPSGIRAVAGDGQATITWNAVSGATSYNMYYATATGVTRASGTRVTGASSGRTVTGLTNGTTCYFVVTALNANGESVESAQVMITPIQATPTAPAAPGGVTASAGNGKVDLSWNAVPGATSYTIYWSTTPDVTKAGGTRITGITTPPYQHPGLTNGLTYYYIVTASNATGESAPSDEVSAEPVLNYAAKLAKISIFNTGNILTGYTTYEYDASGRPLKMSVYGATGVLSTYTTYEYDSANRIIKTSNYTFGGGQTICNYTTTEYNAAGKPVTISNYVSIGATTYCSSYIMNEYDTAGNMTKSTNYNGLSHLVTAYVEYQYNAAGNVTRQTSYAVGGILTGYVTYEYNEAGKRIKSSNFDMNSDRTTYVTTEYDVAGREWKVTTYNGYTTEMTEYTTYEYDAAGNRIKTSKYDFADLLTGYTTVSYNAAKMPVEVCVYGPTGLLKTRTLNSYISIGSTTRESSYDAANNLTGYVTNDYNGVGKIAMASSFDATGALLKYVMTDYDEALRVAQVSTFDSTGLKEYSLNGYDVAGRLVTIRTYGADNALTKSTGKEYNGAGYVTRDTNYDAAGTVTGYVSYEYNVAGKVQKASTLNPASALSKYTTYEYDANGRKIKTSKFDGTDKLTEYTTTEYNAAGKPSKNSTYDGAGALKSYVSYEYAL